MILKPTDAHKCVIVYYIHRIPPTVSATRVVIFREVRYKECIKFKYYGTLNFLKFNIFYLCIGSINFCNISTYVFFVIHSPEDGHMSGRNM
jgi:hypothetical protein